VGDILIGHPTVVILTWRQDTMDLAGIGKERVASVPRHPEARQTFRSIGRLRESVYVDSSRLSNFVVVCVVITGMETQVKRKENPPRR
jgi:hypothetical protein